MKGFTHQGGDNTFVQWKLVPPSGQIACEQRLHRIGSPTAFQRGMSMNSRTSVTTDQGSPPFRIDNAPESELAELLGRVMATRLLVRRTGTDQWQGVPLTKIQQRARYSGTEYDLREVAVKLNALPQFVTEIDGFDIRFVHLRSRHSRAMPLVMPRGRPELVLELLKFIGPLTDPTLHGGQAEDAFDVVIPWMPGYGSSTRLTATCCDCDRTARTWHELMRRLGYERYVCRDSDSGWIVTNVAAGLCRMDAPTRSLQSRPTALEVRIVSLEDFDDGFMS
jgi:hypothetical protein